MTHGILLCDKPAGLSSHQVVARIRRALGTSRVGHAGTLDPMATGLLVLAVGEGLKILRYLALDDKRYRATVRLGIATDSLDADGVESARAALPAQLTLADVRRACSAFVGEIEQLPPAISAIKQAGVPLYKRVRRGEQVEPRPRRVVVHSIEVERIAHDEIELLIRCGSGFYVRSLARDLAHALGTVGHLCALRRLDSGGFSVSDAVALPAVPLEAEAVAALRLHVIAIERALCSAPLLQLDAIGEEHVRHGRRFSIEHVVSGYPGGLRSAIDSMEPVLLRAAAGHPLAIARCEHEMLTIVRGLHLERAGDDRGRSDRAAGDARRQ